MGKNSTSTAHVVITMDGKQALDAMAIIKNRSKELRHELEQMERAGQIDTDDYKAKAKEHQMLERAVRQNKAAYIDLNNIVNELGKTSLLKLEKALKETRRQMYALDPEKLAKEGKNYATELNRLQVIYQKIDNQIGSITGQWRRQDGAIKSVIKRLTAYVSVYGGFNLIKNALSSVAQKNLEFSDQLADIQKTTGLSANNVALLSENINKIDTRTSVQELHDLAYEAGRLGIGGGGADAVLGFVRAANQLKVALGEDLGEDAILQLAKMGDVMGTSNKMGVEKALLATGSAINELSQSSTASGRFISDYAQRLSGIATQAHLTTAELLAFGAASDATGQELEVSATALNKFIVQLQTHYKTVAKAAGVDEEALHQMLTMGETANAVVTVLEALSQKGGLSMLAPLMKDLGSDGARLTASLSTLASNIGLVKEQLEISRDAFGQAISVTNEYNVKNENAAAIMERMRNSWEKMFVNSANVGVVKDLAQQLFDLSNALQQNKLFLTTLEYSMQVLVGTLKLLANMLPFIAVGLSFKGLLAIPALIKGSVAPAFRSLGLALSTSTRAAAGATAATTRFGFAIKGVTALLKSNVFILAASAIATLVIKLVKAKTELSEVEKDMRALNESFATFEHNSSAGAIQVDFLFNKLKNAKKGTKEYKDLMTEINKQYGKYLPNLITEKTSLADLATAHETVNTKLRQSIALKAKNSALDEIGIETMKKLADSRSDIQEVFNKYGLQAMGHHLTSEIQKGAQEDYAKRIPAYTAKDEWTKVYGDRYGLMKPYMDALTKQGAGGGEIATVINSLGTFYDVYYRQQNQILEISKKYDPIIKGFTEPDESGAPYQIVENESESEKNKRENKELRWARDEYKAVMSAIEVFYRQQEQVINKMAEEGKITPTERGLMLEKLGNRQLETQIAARSYLHGDKGAAGAWSAELQKLEMENISQTEATTAALENLWSKDLKKTGDYLRKFGEAQDDAIWKNLETDRVKIQESTLKMQEEVREILMKEDYVGLVTDQYLAAFQKLGFFSSQITDQYGNIIKNYTRDELTGQVARLQSIYEGLFNIDISTADGLELFREALQDIGLTSSYTDEQLRQLYYTTLEYGDAVAEAQRKARNRGQRVADQRWRMGGGLGREAALDREAEAIDSSTSLFSRVGLASDNVANDLEVELYKKRLQAALDYRDTVIESGGDIEKANEKVAESINNLSNVMIEKTMQQLEVLKSFMDPLEELGDEIGAALAIDDSKEKADALSEAFWGAADELADATKDMITNWVKQKLQHAINKRAIEQQERAHQAQQAAIVSTGMATEQTIVQAGEQAKATAVQQSETQISTTKQTHSAQNISTQATETGADAALGIAQGSAKTIGELGWMGIPLVAVISALIGGLLSWAMGKVKGAGKAVTQTAAPTGKVVSSMLAYDSGNVQQVLAGGRVYSARVGGIDGSGLVTRPTLTNVGGQPALVGELGPELVIGRATTRAMMQDNPRLLSSLIQFDRLHSGRGFRAYDSGNVQSMGRGDGSMEDVMQQMVQTLTSLSRTNDRLNRQLALGLKANIIRKELTEETINALYEEKQRGNNKNLKRLLGVS